MSVLLSAEGLTIITSVVVFLIIILILVVVILVAKSKLLPSGNVKIVINDEKELEVPAGGTLLGTLQQEKVYLSSACGGKGTCGECRCRVVEGGGGILPTEVGFFTRKEQQLDWRLSCQVKVKEDSHFVRHDDDIYVEAPVFFTQVALGAKIKIPSLRGELELEIPKNVKDKQQFTFRGEGVKNVQGYGKGNLIVQIKIEYPKSLTTEQKELLEKLQNSFGVESSPSEAKFESMFDKIKNWF